MLTERSTTPTGIVLNGILAAWNAGDPLTKRDLLATLFDELDVDGGQVVGVKPQMRHAVEIAQLVQAAYSTTAKSMFGVGREGVEPPKLSRVVYSHLSSPMPMPTHLEEP